MRTCPMIQSLRFACCFLLLSLVCGASASAHPPVSIVIDSQGRIFYSDLSHVWVINPDGSKEIAVADVHTHELWLDEKDVLYGEDVENLSGDRVRHMVWGRHPDGTQFDHIAWRPGYPEDYGDYGFVLDQAQRVYVLRRSERQIDIRQDNAVVRTISLADYPGHLHWITAAPEGTIFISIGADLYRIKPEDASPALLAQGLIERTEAFDFLHDRHAIMGMWAGNESDVFVSVFSGQVVKRVSNDGTVSIAAQSSGEWSPVGGTFTKDGTLYLLEFSSSNQARVRKIMEDGADTIL